MAKFVAVATSAPRGTWLFSSWRLGDLAGPAEAVGVGFPADVPVVGFERGEPAFVIVRGRDGVGVAEVIVVLAEGGGGLEFVQDREDTEAAGGKFRVEHAVDAGGGIAADVEETRGDEAAFGAHFDRSGVGGNGGRVRIDEIVEGIGDVVVKPGFVALEEVVEFGGEDGWDDADFEVGVAALDAALAFAGSEVGDGDAEREDAADLIVLKREIAAEEARAEVPPADDELGVEGFGGDVRGVGAFEDRGEEPGGGKTFEGTGGGQADGGCYVGPASRRSRNAGSSRMVRPNFSAFSSLLPASVPATT